LAEDALPPGIIEVGPGFWNIRGSFKIGGVIQLGTQCSLVRRTSGSYLFLDTCDLSDAAREWIRGQTDGGKDIEAILNLHPFHTVYVKAQHKSFPSAKLYGTARHAERLPDLVWQDVRTEDDELHRQFAEDLEFSVPRGVDFIPSDESLHFSSVLAFHGASKTLHVDDTLVYLRLPWLLRAFVREQVTFHFTLAKVLEKRAGAAADFRQWAKELVDRCKGVENLCAAHLANLLARDNAGAPLGERVQAALDKVEGKLAAHERKFG
jgi:hypothetical protein